MNTAPPPRPAPPKRRRERLGIFFLVALASALAVVALVWPELRSARQIVRREDLARDALMRVHAAQEQLRVTAGRYGFVRDLAKAGLLDDLVVVDKDGVSWVETEGFRIDVLLPHARLGSKVVGIVPEGSEKPVDAELRELHFSVVARPQEPGLSGFRMWYVDEQGELYLNEGVIDDVSSARNELPTTQVRHNVALDTASYLLWQRASQVPPSKD